MLHSHPPQKKKKLLTRKKKVKQKMHKTLTAVDKLSRRYLPQAKTVRLPAARTTQVEQ